MYVMYKFPSVLDSAIIYTFRTTDTAAVLWQLAAEFYF